MKSGLGRITENTPQYQGVIVYNMADLPLVILHCLILYIFREMYTWQAVSAEKPPDFGLQVTEFESHRR